MSISVIIPAYNAASFIAATLRSVLEQTHPAKEILVIDDGSSDDTATIAKGFGSPVRVICRINAGQGASRNFGAREAASEWIAFLDADDLWDPNKLSRQMEELGRDPLADLCYTSRVNFEEHDNVVTYGIITTAPPVANIRTALFRNTTFMPSSTVIRRSVFLAAGGFDTQFKIVEDWDLWLRLLHRGILFAVCREPLLQYRIHPDSVSHQAIPALEEAKQIFRVQVMPYLPRSTRWVITLHSQSGQEANAALVLRRLSDARHLRMMATSLLRFPFSSTHRYTIFAHMLYTHLRQMLRAKSK